MIAASSPPPMAPPIKKQRASDTPESRSAMVTDHADQALSNRRAELRRLQVQMRSRPNPGATPVGGGGGTYEGSAALLDRARNELRQPSPTSSSAGPPVLSHYAASAASGPAPPLSGTAATAKPPVAPPAAGPPAHANNRMPSRMPPQIASGGIHARRDSDIFPSVQPKSPSTTRTALTVEAVASRGGPPPVMPTKSLSGAPPAAAAASASATPGKTTTSTAGGPVARRLEASFAARGSDGGAPPPPQQPGKKPPVMRPKSAPPARPPPPPAPPSSNAVEEPPTSGIKQQQQQQQRQQQQERGFVGRPDPMAPPLVAAVPNAPAPPKAAAPPKPRVVAPANRRGPVAPGPPPRSSSSSSTHGPPAASSPSVLRPLTPAAGATSPHSTAVISSSPGASTAPPTPPITSAATEMNNKTQIPKSETPKPASLKPEIPTPQPQKPKGASTPYPGATRRDMLRSMRDAADTPPVRQQPSAATPWEKRKEEEEKQEEDALSVRTEPTSNTSPKVTQESPELRLQKELVRTEKEKSDAYRQVRLLEEEIQKSRQQEQRQKQVGFMSPVGNFSAGPDRAGTPAMTPLAGSVARRRFRTPTPHPKKSKGKKLSKEEERRYQTEAVESTPYEFFSTEDDPHYAKFTIRRPFGMVEGQEERQLWKAAQVEASKKYEKFVNVEKPWTLDVVAQVEADGSLLVLTGKDHVKFLRNATDAAKDGPWKDFGDIHARNRPLGVITYIDAEANEKEYHLDEIAAMALEARYHYCDTVLSTAAFIRDRPAVPPTPIPATQQQSPPAAAAAALAPLQPRSPTSDACVGTEPVTAAVPPADSRAETADACVGTEDLKFPPSEAPKADRTLQETTKKAKAPQPPEEDGGSDVLGVFVGMLFSTVAWLLWTVFVRIPFRILSTTMIMGVAVVLLSLIWLYLEDDHGADAMSATIDGARYNPPGIL